MFLESFFVSCSFVCSHLKAFNFNLIMSIPSAGELQGWCWIFHTHVISRSTFCKKMWNIIFKFVVRNVSPETKIFLLNLMEASITHLTKIKRTKVNMSQSWVAFCCFVRIVLMSVAYEVTRSNENWKFYDEIFLSKLFSDKYLWWKEGNWQQVEKDI